jgi:hypothetical protein
MNKPKRKIPPLYWPYKSWKQAAYAYAFGLVGLTFFYWLKSLIQ